MCHQWVLNEKHKSCPSFRLATITTLDSKMDQQQQDEYYGWNVSQWENPAFGEDQWHPYSLS